MNKFKKALVSCLTLGMVFTSIPQGVLAEDYSTDINIETQASTISVEVPGELSWILNADGTNTVTTDFGVTNNSAVEVVLKTATFTGQNGWSLSKETSFTDNTKALNLKLNGIEQENNVYTFEHQIAKGEKYAITFDLPSAGNGGRANFTSNVSSEKAFSVVFEFGYVDSGSIKVYGDNNTWSGESLGTEITTTQLAAIKDGSFDGIGLGDYWTLDGKTWRVAHFNYVEGGENNLTIVPDESLGIYQMNSSYTNATGYYGSAGYATLHSTVKDALPEVLKSHLYTHDVVVSTATASDYTNTWETKSSDGIELMSIANVYGQDYINLGSSIIGWSLNPSNGYASASSDKQFAMFKFATDGTSLEVSDYKTTKADNIVKSYWYWLSGSVVDSSFAYVASASGVSGLGYSLYNFGANNYRGALRPALTIIGE